MLKVNFFQVSFQLISNMATVYLMVRDADARDAIWNPGVQISKTGAEFMPPGEQN